MQWSHLPVPGGLYAQHPRLLDEWQEIFEIKHQVESQQAAREEAKKRKPGTP